MQKGRTRLFIPREEIPRGLYLTLSILGFLTILGAWSAVTYTGVVDPLFLPTPTRILVDGWRLVTQLGFGTDVLVTVARVLAGFGLAAVIAIPLGIVMGTFRPVAAFVQPVMSFMRYLPASAFIPLFILWIGLEEPEKVAVIFVGSFFSLVLMVAVTANAVPRELLEVSYTLGVTPGTVVWRVLMPSALPAIVDTLIVTLGWAWTYIIVAELVGADSGIGHRILESQRTLRTGYIIFGIVTIGLVGLVSDLFLTWLRRRLFPWTE